ncbi:MAG: selenocysteine-specific translation elongation factor [Planctomycetota bacterium]
MHTPLKLMVGTAGHVDHGKTTLVRQLTGVDTDTAPEEKSRGMSINLGFAPCILEEGLTVGLVDVPGHEKFIRNMIAGATGMDLVMLVVAADDGIMPQTREHLHILTLLGIPRGLVVLNKCDLVDKDTLDLVELELADLLKGTFLESSPVLRVSAQTGQGIGTLKDALRSIALETPAKKSTGFFRLPILRSFQKEGFGTVVTGIPFSGSLKVEDEVEVLPGHHRGRVRSLQAYGHTVDRVEAGHSVAVNVHGIAHEHLVRGAWIAAPGCFSPAMTLEGKLALIQGAKTPRDHSEITLFIGSQSLKAAWVRLSDSLVQFRSHEPMLAITGDRFLVRDSANRETLGGGTVISTLSKKLTRRLAGDVAALEQLSTLNGSVSGMLLALLGTRGAHAFKNLEELEQTLNKPRGEFEAILADLVEQGSIIRSGKLFHLPEAPSDLLAEAVALAERYAKAHPGERWITAPHFEKLGPGWSVVKGRKDFGATFAESHGKLALRTHLVALTHKQRKMADHFLEAVRRGGFTPALPEDILRHEHLPPKTLASLLQALTDNGEVVRLNEQVFWAPETYEKALETIRAIGQTKGLIEIADIKETLGLTRKFAIPLLEATDEAGVTKRTEKGRVLKERDDSV